MLNVKLLQEVVSESGISITNIAKKMKLSREGLYQKLSGKTEFKVSEIEAITAILHLDNRRRDSIFFEK